MTPEPARRITLDLTAMTLDSGRAEAEPLREELELLLAGQNGEPVEAVLELIAELYLIWGRLSAVSIAEQLIRDGIDAHIKGLEPGDLEGLA